MAVAGSGQPGAAETAPDGVVVGGASVSGPGAPPVVAVVVARDPGDWFEATLESLEAQDYAQLSILVVDNGGSEDPTPRVADVAPFAFVKRLEDDEGFSNAANEALRSVQGAPFVLICHDDVRLAPDAVTQMVAEALRSNAGIVGPKLVEWDDERVLCSVGLSVDQFGAAVELVDPGELDQSQHDISRRIFAVSDACMLVRADLFETVAGFSEAIPFFGEDVDLCWKAQLAGATVQFAHRSTVGHRNAFEHRRATDARERLELRNQARMTLANHSTGGMLRALPRAFVLSLAEMVAALFLGRGRTSVDILATWGWVLVHPLEVLRARRRRKPYRRVAERDWLPTMRRGSNRLRALAGTAGGENRVVAATRAGRARMRSATEAVPSSRLGITVAVAVPLLLLLGARSLWLGDLPSMREFTSLGDSVGALLSEWWTGWRAPGLGEASVPPGAIPGLGALGSVLLLSAGAARRVLLLAPLVLGPVGAWRLLPARLSLRAKAAALTVYALSPVALNALGEARLQALVAYAAAPWVLRRVAGYAGLEPFVASDDRADLVGARRTNATRRHLAGTALLLGLVGAVSPLAAIVVAVTVVAMVIGPALTGQRGSAALAVRNVLLALVGAALLNAPWLLAAVRRGDAATLTGLWEGRGPLPSTAEMLTGSVGPLRTGILGWGIVLAAAVPLLTGKQWRLGWAAGAWLAIVVGLGASVLAARADLLAGAGVEVLLVPLALGLAMAVAMAPLAFEHDVVRSDFGSRQLLSGIGLVALVVGLLPVVVATTQGRWYLPEGDFSRVLSVVDDGDDYRTLWIGDPDVLPLSGWETDTVAGLSVGMSHGMSPVMSDRYRLDGGTSIDAVSEALTGAVEGRTARLGRAVAPMTVRYVVVVDRPAPEPFASTEVGMPDGIVDALEEQLDLKRILVGPGIDLFEVSAPWPVRSDITDPPEPGTAPPAVLGDGFGTAFSGELEDDRVVAQSVTADPGWSLRVGGEEVESDVLFSYGQKYITAGGGAGGSGETTGEASMRWSPSLVMRLLQLWQFGALVGLVVLATRRGSLPAPRRRRRRVPRPEEPLVVVEGPGGLAEDWVGPGTASGADEAVDDAAVADEGGPDDGGADAAGAAEEASR